QAFPTLTVVAAHFGGWTEWEDAVQTLAGQYKNLYVDTCSSLHWLSPARARGVVRAFGANKVLFGTDYPMWDAADELAMLRAAGLRQTELELVLHKNAEHVYRLQPRRV
ncbi:MAG: amidohydrolase family protein, partial [Oscillospiraceae bacterium]|nr:amidohydrolase family protein [Oscillospiraceae bacterium]